jgi:predicted esterase
MKNLDKIWDANSKGIVSTDFSDCKLSEKSIETINKIIDSSKAKQSDDNKVCAYLGFTNGFLIAINVMISSRSKTGNIQGGYSSFTVLDNSKFENYKFTKILKIKL